MQYPNATTHESDDGTNDYTGDHVGPFFYSQRSSSWDCKKLSPVIPVSSSEAGFGWRKETRQILFVKAFAPERKMVCTMPCLCHCINCLKAPRLSQNGTRSLWIRPSTETGDQISEIVSCDDFQCRRAVDLSSKVVTYSELRFPHFSQGPTNGGLANAVSKFTQPVAAAIKLIIHKNLVNALAPRHGWLRCPLRSCSS